MSTATFGEIRTFDVRLRPGAGRGLIRTLALGAAATASVAAAGASATVIAAWLFSAAISGSAHIQAKMPARAGAPVLSIRATEPAVAASESNLPLAARLARARSLAFELAGDAPPARTLQVAEVAPPPLTAPVPLPRARPEIKPGMTPDLPLESEVMHTASIPPAPAPAAPVAIATPMPLPNPVRQEATRPPEVQPAPQLASLTPPQQTPEPAAPAAPAAPARTKAFSLPDRDSRTAVYDISARTVYLPNGERLEAHSGLGDKIDDPRYAHVRMRGVTPPNVYTLTMREQLFHGVRAIRLNPVDEGKMHGRDGILAHTYMLGPNGQSNGCVSFKNYDKFLRAFLDGQVDRMVVVASLDGRPPPNVARNGRSRAGRYASAEAFDRATEQAW